MKTAEKQKYAEMLTKILEIVEQQEQGEPFVTKKELRKRRLGLGLCSIIHDTISPEEENELILFLQKEITKERYSKLPRRLLVITPLDEMEYYISPDHREDYNHLNDLKEILKGQKYIKRSRIYFFTEADWKIRAKWLKLVIKNLSKS